MIAVAPSIAKQKKKVRDSRKGAKSWRKNISAEEIEAGLEDVRAQERAGGVLAEKTDAELFSIDHKGDVLVRRRARESRPLKIEQVLVPTSSVSVQPSHKRASSVIKQPSKVLKTPVFPQPKDTTPKVYDLWATDLAVGSFPRRSKCTIPAVQVPHAGASYNPNELDHQNIIQQAARQERRRIAKSQKAANKIRGVYSAVAEPDPLQIKSLQSLLDPEAKEDQSTKYPEDAVVGNLPAVPRRKKTRTERNREAKLKVEALNLVDLKRKKKLRVQFSQLPRIANLTQAEAQRRTEQLRHNREIRLLRRVSLTKRLGPLKYEPAPVAVQLREEFGGSLRLLKPEGSQTLDRFKSLQQRNLIEPRTRQRPRRRYELKTFEKRGHKNINI